MVEVSKPRRRPSIVNPETGESGKYRRVQGRHVFEPSAEQEASEIGEKELERWEHPSPSFKENDEKDKNTYGYGRPNDGSDPRPDETYRGTRGDAIESETYIGTGSKTDMDKLADTKFGDKIKYFDNGVEGNGTVVKISGSYITLLKSNGYFQDIHINDISWKVVFNDSLMFNKIKIFQLGKKAPKRFNEINSDNISLQTSWAESLVSINKLIENEEVTVISEFDHELWKKYVEKANELLND